MNAINHGENSFQNAQQAREVLLASGFLPLCRLNDAEHWVRNGRRCVLTYRGDRAADVPLDGAEFVWFRRLADGTVYAVFG